MDDSYVQYAKTLADAANLRSEISEKERLLGDLRDKLLSEEDGSIGIDMSAHASKQILERLEELASESSYIYEDVWKPKDISSSLMSPTNMRAFIIGIIARAKENGEVTEKNSKNSSGKEYHYTVEIKKWSTDNKKLTFTGIVENNVIKTGYFNWM